MFKEFYRVFSRLPRSNKSMVYLSWIYNIGVLIGPLFINIYVYNINGSVVESLIYNTIFFTASFFSFVGIGFLMSAFQKDVRHLYYPAYICFIASFFFPFLFDGLIIGAYLMAMLYGFGNGLFWCALHSQELKNIEDHHRDFFSSSIGLGKSVLALLVPILLTFCLYIGKIFEYDGFLILFFILALIYCISFLFIKRIPSYIPQKTKIEDITNFFNFRQYKYGHFYYFFDGMKLVLSTITIALASIALFQEVLYIGIFQIILAFISVFLVTHLGLKSKPDNRLMYHRYIVAMMIGSILLLLGVFSITGFIIFSLINVIIEPLFKVSSHIYNLRLMDNIKQGNSDFYPAMILREVILWTGRVTGILVLFVCYSFFDTEGFLQLGLLLSAIAYLLMHICLIFWERYENNNIILK